MAVPEQTPFIEYTANGTTTSFALEFDCDNQDHLIVLVDDIEPAVGTWSLSSGAVVFNTAPENGKKITLQRSTPLERTTDYQSYNNSFRPPAVNKDFDWIWLKLQELGVADWILGKRIDALKNYVDRKDDELKAYLMEEIRKQGVALDQLEDYYNYLMARLAQIAVDKGWDASFVVDGDKTQKQINAALLDGFAYVEWFGDTINDATNAINMCLLYCLNYNKTAKGIPNKTYTISDTIVIQSSCDFAKSKFEAPLSLNKPAIQVTNRGTGLTHIRAKSIKLPEITNNRELGVVPTVGSIGVQILGGMRNCDVVFDNIYGFEENLQLKSDTPNNDEFIAYNKFTFNGLFAGSKVNVHMWISNTGWINQCQWIGGQFAGYSQDRTVFESRNLKISKTTATGNNPPNGHTFLGCSMEGAFTQTIEYNLHVDVTTSYYSINAFVNCRFEQAVSMKFSPFSLYDTFVGCYGLNEVAFVDDVRPTIIGSPRTGHMLIDVAAIVGATGSRTAKNTFMFSASNTSFAMPLTVGFNKKITGGLEASGSYVMFHPIDATLLQPLVRIATDAGSPSILMGDGTTAPTEKIFRYAPKDWRHTFNLRPSTDLGSQLGTASNRYKELHVQDVAIYPPTTNNPTSNGEMTFELASDTQLNVKVRGSDGVIRSTTLTLV